jgi:hypothetical protein
MTWIGYRVSDKEKSDRRSPMPDFPGRLAALLPSAFVKLAALLNDVAPGQPPISLALGDPQGEVPSFVIDTIVRYADKFGFYPPIDLGDAHIVVRRIDSVGCALVLRAKGA